MSLSWLFLCILNCGGLDARPRANAWSIEKHATCLSVPEQIHIQGMEGFFAAETMDADLLNDVADGAGIFENTDGEFDDETVGGAMAWLERTQPQSNTQTQTQTPQASSHQGQRAAEAPVREFRAEEQTSSAGGERGGAVSRASETAAETDAFVDKMSGREVVDALRNVLRETLQSAQASTGVRRRIAEFFVHLMSVSSTSATAFEERRNADLAVFDQMIAHIEACRGEAVRFYDSQRQAAEAAATSFEAVVTRLDSSFAPLHEFEEIEHEAETQCNHLREIHHPYEISRTCPSRSLERGPVTGDVVTATSATATSATATSATATSATATSATATSAAITASAASGIALKSAAADVAVSADVDADAGQEDDGTFNAEQSLRISEASSARYAHDLVATLRSRQVLLWRNLQALQRDVIDVIASNNSLRALVALSRLQRFPTYASALGAMQASDAAAAMSRSQGPATRGAPGQGVQAIQGMQIIRARKDAASMHAAQNARGHATPSTLTAAAAELDWLHLEPRGVAGGTRMPAFWEHQCLSLVDVPSFARDRARLLVDLVGALNDRSALAPWMQDVVGTWPQEVEFSLRVAFFDAQAHFMRPSPKSAVKRSGVSRTKPQFVESLRPESPSRFTWGATPVMSTSISS